MKKSFYQVTGIVNGDITYFSSEGIPVCHFHLLPIKEGIFFDAVFSTCEGDLAKSFREKVVSGTSIKIDCVVKDFVFRSTAEDEHVRKSGLSIINFEILEDMELLNEDLSQRKLFSYDLA